MSLIRHSLLICVALSATQTFAQNRFTFAALGDTPYYAFEEVRLEKLFADINGEPLAFVVHIGDIKSARDPCDDKLYRKRKALFDTIRHPFLITPGDNDWTDCWGRYGPANGGYDPEERLEFERKTFFSTNQSLGAHTMTVERESSEPA